MRSRDETIFTRRQDSTLFHSRVTLKRHQRGFAYPQHDIPIVAFHTVFWTHPILEKHNENPRPLP